MQHFDVIIIGAGASGLMAALECGLAGKKTAVIEAKNQTGGRAVSINKPGFQIPVEAGAEFVHGNLELTLLLLKKAGIDYYEVTGDIWQKSDGKWDEQKDFVEDFKAVNKKLKSVEHDISVKQFIDEYLSEPKFEDARFTLQNYVEGYFAADTNRASTFTLRDDLNKSDEEQYRIYGGYSKLFAHLFDQCKEKEVQFFFSQPASEVVWEKGKVSMKTSHASFTADKLLVTVPIGVLQSRSIQFSPALPEKENAAQQLGFGSVIKTLLQFKNAFWKNEEFSQGNDLGELGFIFSQEKIPTWWTRHPEELSILTGWSGGPHADELKDLSAEQILDTALQSLANIFDVTKDFLQEHLLAWHVADWINDPFCRGGYSYDVVNGKAAKQTLLQPVENTIWFTGEGLFDGAEIGTVNAALVMGRNSAFEIIASFKS